MDEHEDCVTRADLEDLRAEMNDKIEDLRRDLDDLREGR